MRSPLGPLIQQHPEFAPAAATLRILATTLPEPTLPDHIPHLGAAEARLSTGVPALEGEPLLTGPALVRNVRVLIEALGEMLQPPGAVPEALEQSAGAIGGGALATAALAGSWDLLAEIARRAGVDSHLAITLVDYAARPALRAGTAAARDLIARSRWTRATCPGCGAAPLLAELRGGGSSVAGAEQERVLRCGRCLAAWAFPRLCCIGCGETRHQQLAYLHGPGEDGFRRADVCSTCGTYLKCIAVLAPLPLPELLDLDLATAALDIAALEQGLHR